jgi:DNA-binding response OmpR family regulator
VAEENKKTIMVCDDFPQVEGYVSRILMEGGYTVMTCNTVELVRSMVGLKQHNLIVIDDLGGGGIELAAELYAAGDNVLITSTVPGAEGVPRFPKPFKPKELLDKIAELLSNKKA